MSTVAERTRRERKAQGLGEQVTNEGLLDQVAVLLEDTDGPETTSPGRSLTVPPPHTTKGPVRHAPVP
jgi:hypothetical protein